MMAIITLHHLTDVIFRATLYYNDDTWLPVYDKGQKKYSVETTMIQKYAQLNPLG